MRSGGWGPYAGIDALVIGNARELPPLFLFHNRKAAACKPARESSPETKTCQNLKLVLSSLQN